MNNTISYLTINDVLSNGGIEIDGVTFDAEVNCVLVKRKSNDIEVDFLDIGTVSVITSLGKGLRLDNQHFKTVGDSVYQKFSMEIIRIAFKLAVDAPDYKWETQEADVG